MYSQSRVRTPNHSIKRSSESGLPTASLPQVRCFGSNSKNKLRGKQHLPFILRIQYDFVQQSSEEADRQTDSFCRL